MEYFDEKIETKKIKNIQNLLSTNPSLIEKAKCIHCSCIGTMSESIFCKNCLEVFCSLECQSSYKKGNPLCRLTSEPCDNKMNSDILQEIDDLRLLFVCPNYIRGCKKKMSYSEFYNSHSHIEICPFREMICKECGITICARDIKKHIMKCQFCNMTILKEKEMKHYETQCEYWVEYCNKCLTPKDKMNLSEHSEKICAILSEKKKELTSFMISLILRQKMFCEECNELLPSKQHVDLKKMKLEDITKIMPKGYDDICETDIPSDIIEEETISFKICGECHRLLCRKEYYLESLKCMSCSTSNKKIILGKEESCPFEKKIIQNYCETHHKYQLGNPTYCKNCGEGLLYCCGYCCIHCLSLYCSNCVNLKDDPKVFCMICKTCFKCIDSGISSINKKHNIHQEKKERKIYFSSIKPKEGDVDVLDEVKKIKLRKSASHVPKDVVGDDNRLELDFDKNKEEKEYERLSTRIDTSPSHNLNEKLGKKAIEAFLEDTEDLEGENVNLSRRKTCDFTSMPKQICKDCGAINLYFEVECIHCKKFL